MLPSHYISNNHGPFINYEVEEGGKNLELPENPSKIIILRKETLTFPSDLFHRYHSDSSM